MSDAKHHPKAEEFEDTWAIVATAAWELEGIAKDLVAEFASLETPEIDDRVVMAAFVLTYSMDNLFGNTLQLANRSQFLAVAIMTRSIIEGAGNTLWLLADDVGSTDTIDRATEMESLSAELDDLFRGSITRRTKLSGSITSRVEMLGGGFKIIYGHLCSFSHMDAAFTTHYLHGEQKGALNLFVLWGIAAMADALWVINKAFDIDDKFSARLLAMKGNLNRKLVVQNPGLASVEMFVF